MGFSRCPRLLSKSSRMLEYKLIQCGKPIRYFSPGKPVDDSWIFTQLGKNLPEPVSAVGAAIQTGHKECQTGSKERIQARRALKLIISPLPAQTASLWILPHDAVEILGAFTKILSLGLRE